MSAKALVDNGKWIYWLVTCLAGLVITGPSLAIAGNRSDIADLREWKGGAEAKIEYTAKGVRRLEDKWGTYVAPKAKE